jgi:hypothetical protein
MNWEGKIFPNKYRLVHRTLPVRVMKFDGRYWVEDGWARGALVETTTWLCDKWYERPENRLQPL